MVCETDYGSFSRELSVTGFSTGSLVVSLIILKSSLSGLFTASAIDQPVSASAVGLMKVMRPLMSVAITASPMLESATRS